MRVGLLLISSLIAALVMGCGSAPIRTEGIAGPVTWQAMDFQLAKATVNNQPGERYSFTLLLKETRGAGMTFTEIKWTISQHGVTPTTSDRTGRWRLPPHGQWRVPFSFSWYCPQAFESCAGARGVPQWNIILTGTNDRGQPVQVVIAVAPPSLLS
jgi:hypothetical protein